MILSAKVPYKNWVMGGRNQLWAKGFKILSETQQMARTFNTLILG